jgi:hypothetical protein
MPVALYMDVHIPKAITLGLRLRGVDVLTSQEDKTTEQSDEDLLEIAGLKNRILFSFDTDFLKITKNLKEKGIEFTGLIYAHPLRISIGKCINDLELIAKLGNPEEFKNKIEFLPL